MSLTEAIFARPSYSQMERLIVAEEVKNRIMSTYVGTHLVASTAADMTDTDRIYVYVGSETGYTSGNWYYYDGSAWTSGGVYNSTAFETDDTLTIPDAAADSKAVGDELSDLKNALTLQEETIPDTVQTITFDSAGNVSAITHTANNVAVRTDAFTFGTDTITEVRTLSTGESLTIVTNTTTLQTTVTYAAA